MELMEAIFQMFGESIASRYLKLIEKAYPPKEQKDKTAKALKAVVRVGFATLFVVAVLSLMCMVAFEGVLRTIGVVVFAVCLSVVLLYVLSGYILKRAAERKTKN